MCSVVQLLHTSDRELQVTLRDVALVLVVKLFSILRHKLSGCTQTYIVDSLLSRNRGCVTVDWEHLAWPWAVPLFPTFHDFPVSHGSLGSVHFSSVFSFSGSDDFYYLSSGLLTVSVSSPVGWEVLKFQFTFYIFFSSYTFSFGVSIWFFFQVSLLHRDYHRVSIPSCCYSWTFYNDCVYNIWARWGLISTDYGSHPASCIV